VLLGPAPLHAATRTGHAEIAQIFTSPAPAHFGLRAHAATATQADILAVRARGLIGLNDSLLRGPLSTRESSAEVRVLLLGPSAPAAAVRAAEAGESLESFTAGIRLALARLAEFDHHPRIRLRTAGYGSLPTWRMLAFDEVLYLPAFGASSEGHRSGMSKLTASADGVLRGGFRRHFDDMWHRATNGGRWT
jgi:hypothetical protein